MNMEVVLKALNIHRKKSFDEAENLHKKQIIAEALELHESRIKRFIRILLSKSQVFHSNEELKERADVFQRRTNLVIIYCIFSLNYPMVKICFSRKA